MRSLAPENPELEELLRKSVEAVKNMTPLERRRMDWDQRVSFVYGNQKLSNDSITREMVIAAVTRIYGPRP